MVVIHESLHLVAPQIPQNIKIAEYKRISSDVGYANGKWERRAASEGVVLCEWI